ncbi:MAG: esterase/lipase family protein [Ornithinibacter sp.]
MALLSLRPSIPVDQSVAGPVLLVPGYGGSTRSLDALARSLREQGRDATVVALPDRAQGDLDDQAKVLGVAADAALARTRRPSVDVVGYSAGGVVARLWATEGGGSDHLRRLVTLGSPHHGTDLASLGSLAAGSCPAACRQLAPDSPLLARLDAEPVPAGLVFVSLWTTLDEVVVPASSAVVDGVPSPSLQSICPGAAARHGDLPGDPLVQALVREVLSREALPSWTTADCDRLGGAPSS